MDRFSLGVLVAKIVSFGDSFVLGNELEKEDGSCAWPGLIAKKLHCEYHTAAVAGCGNEYISQQIFDYFDPDKNYHDTLAIINWTWSMRWDFYVNNQNTWIGLGPTCVPERIKQLVEHNEAKRLINFYQDFLEPAESWHRLRSLSSIYAAQKFLQSLGVKNIQTYMDPVLWYGDTPKLEHYYAIKSPSWPDISDEKDISGLPVDIQKEINDNYDMINPGYIKTLRKLTVDQLHTFNNLTFLEWSKKMGYEITTLLHPSQEAHNAAADLWESSYIEILKS